jgi:hypothetical protein
MWQALDTLSHRIWLPRKVQRFICDMYELSLGIHPEQLEMDYRGQKTPWWIRRHL